MFVIPAEAGIQTLAIPHECNSCPNKEVLRYAPAAATEGLSPRLRGDDTDLALLHFLLLQMPYVTGDLINSVTVSWAISTWLMLRSGAAAVTA
ncbi:hypothetical protein V22_07630 [Calycomorphotria hydatis]|uniref:Uncharacterized protein n=1 Tax=Calycomorphotria hydatis TaxID=2528027 RepID=A0A517T592_9PLAN|nr:hypothetical protein V22_07630 [Calycomorphotria hydatis]